MIPRLKQIFGNVSPNRLKAVAQTYTENMKTLSMDTCWVKAHFFAQTTIETGYTLNISENMNYRRERFEDIFPSNIFKGRWTKDGKWVSDRDKNGKRIYKDGMKKTLDMAYSITDIQKRKIVLANIAYANRNGNGDYYSGDGWRFRGSGLVQITGRENYSKIQHLINTKFKLNVDIMTNGADTLNGNDRIATLASMCYVYICLKRNPQNYCNNVRNTKSFSKVVGNNIKEKGKPSSWEQKQNSFNLETSKAFVIDQCNLSENKKIKDGQWHDPVDNPQIAVFTQKGNDNPANQVFGTTRGRAHQGIDLFALEGSNLYACLSGKVVITRNKGKAGHQYVVIEVSKKSQIEIFRKRRRNDYKKIDPKEYLEGEGFNKDSDKIYFVYYHMSKILVNEGQDVNAGDVIGKSGITGIDLGTHGPHLHFEIKSVNSFPSGLAGRVNPALYLDYKKKSKLTEAEMNIQRKRKEKGYK